MFVLSSIRCTKFFFSEDVKTVMSLVCLGEANHEGVSFLLVVCWSLLVVYPPSSPNTKSCLSIVHVTPDRYEPPTEGRRTFGSQEMCVGSRPRRSAWRYSRTARKTSRGNKYFVFSSLPPTIALFVFTLSFFFCSLFRSAIRNCEMCGRGQKMKYHPGIAVPMHSSLTT